MSASSSTSSFEVNTAQAATDRRRFLHHAVAGALLFSILPLLYVAFLLAADPFQLFHLPFSVSTEASRTEYAAHLNPSLYRLIAFRRNPLPDILLGDSRMALFHEPDIKKLTGRDVFNLSIPGGTLEMTIDTFWYAAEHARLRSVALAVSLDAYTDFKLGSEIATMRGMDDNPLLYFTNRNVFTASVEAYRRRLGFAGSNELTLERFTREQIWSDGLQFLRSSFSKWRKPVRFHARLEEIAGYCRKNNIALRFVILPQHDDAWRLVDEYGLQQEQEKMKVALADLAPVLDLSARTGQTADANNFTDVVHFRGQIVLDLIRRLWPAS